jgi:hypothetical protein
MDNERIQQINEARRRAAEWDETVWRWSYALLGFLAALFICAWMAHSGE